MWIPLRRLRSDIDRWVASGWVTEDGARAIRSELDERGGPGLASVLAILAAVLLGFAAMSFVAANWQGMSKLTRLLVLITGLWGAYGGAAVLAQRGLQRFAEAATLTGVGIFGAGIMLISQMYHMEGNPPDAVLLWAIGALTAGVLLRSNAATAAAMPLALLWSGWDMQLANAAHWLFLPAWAAIAAVFYWRRWWPGLHLAIAAIATWIVMTTEMLGFGHRHETIMVAGIATAIGSACLGAMQPRLAASTQVVTAYGSVLAFAGAFAWQFLRFFKAPAPILLIAVVTLVLLLALIAWGWRISDRSLVWLGYAGFSIEILGLYFRTIGTLLSTSLFFLIAGLIVMLLAGAAWRLAKSSTPSKEVVS